MRVLRPLSLRSRPVDKDLALRVEAGGLGEQPSSEVADRRDLEGLAVEQFAGRHVQPVAAAAAVAALGGLVILAGPAAPPTVHATEVAVDCERDQASGLHSAPLGCAITGPLRAAHGRLPSARAAAVSTTT